MIAMLFVACDNNNDDGANDGDTSSSDVVIEGDTMAGGEEFANDNEAIYKDSWK